MAPITLRVDSLLHDIVETSQGIEVPVPYKNPGVS